MNNKTIQKIEALITATVLAVLAWTAIELLASTLLK